MNNNNDDNKGDIDMLLPRRNYNLFDEFFDNDFWGVKISCIKTDDLHLIISKIYSLLNQFVND